MASDMDFGNDFDNMDFDLESSFGGKPKKKSAFKDLAKGITVGSFETLKKYIPAVDDTVSGFKDLRDEMSKQAQVLSQNTQKVSSYLKNLKTDINKIKQDIKGKSFKEKADIIQKGISSARKNLAIEIGGEDAKEMIDMMEGLGFDDEINDIAKSKVTNDGKPSIQQNSKTDKKTGTKIINTKLYTFKSDSAKSTKTLTESMVDTTASMIKNNNQVSAQMALISAKQHSEKMEVFNRISSTLDIMGKFNAELFGPALQESRDYNKKFEAQLNDLIDILRPDSKGIGATSLFQGMLAGAMKKKGYGSRKSVFDFVGSGGGININEIYKQMMGSFKENTMAGSALDMLGSMKDMLPMMLMGRGGGSAMFNLGKLLPGLMAMPFKGKATQLSDQLKEQMPVMLAKFSEYGKKKGGLLEQLAELLNLDTSVKGSVSTQMENRKVPFDMTTRRSIIEVIPGYLSKIYSAVSGSPELTYDYKSGKFLTLSSARSANEAKISQAGTSELYQTKSNIKNALSKSALSELRGLANDPTLDENINKVLSNITMSGKTFSPKDIDKYLEGIDPSYRSITKKAFLEAYTDMEAYQGGSRARLQTDIMRARESKTKTLKEMEVEGLEYGKSALYGKTHTMDQIRQLEEQLKDEGKANDPFYKRNKEHNLAIKKQINELKTMAKLEVSANDAEGGGVFGKIYSLLAKGIIVFPSKRTPTHLREINKSFEKEKKDIEERQKIEKEAKEEYLKSIQSQTGETGAYAEEMRQRKYSTLGDMFGRFKNSSIGQMLNKTGILDTMERLVAPISNVTEKINSKITSATQMTGDIMNEITGANIGASGTPLRGSTNYLERTKTLALNITKAKSSKDILKALEKSGFKLNAKIKAGLAKIPVDKAMEYAEMIKNKGADALPVIQAELGLVIKNYSQKTLTAIGNVGAKIAEKGGQGISAIGRAIPELADKIQPTIMDAKNTKNIIGGKLNQGLQKLNKLGIIGQMKAWGTTIFEKFSRSLFGMKDMDGNLLKEGIIGNISNKFKSLTDSFLSWLVGDKQKGKTGILQKLGQPVLKQLEKGRHWLTKTVLLPLTHVAKVAQESAKWAFRGVKDSVVRGSKNILGGIAGFLAKESKKAKEGKGGLASKLLGGAYNFGTKTLGNVIKTPVQMAYNAAKKQQLKLLAEGKISQDQYDEWNSEYQQKLDKEEGRHGKAMSDISAMEEKISMESIKDEKTRERVSGFKSKMSEIEKQMKSEGYNEQKDIERAKKQKEANLKKLKAGGTLSEKEMAGARTLKEQKYFEEDQMKNTLEKELKRQEETRMKEQMENQHKQLGFIEKIEGLVRTIVEKGTGVGKAISKKITGGKAGDVRREGSREDMKADKEEASVPENLNMIAKHTQETAGAFKKGGVFSKFMEKMGGGGKGILGMLGQLVKTIGGIGLLAAAAGITTLVAVKGKKITDAFKQKGFIGGIKELTGIGKDTADSAYDSEGKEKGAAQRAVDDFKVGRFVARGGLQKTAGMFATGIKLITPKFVKNIASSAGKGIAKQMVKTAVGKSILKGMTTKGNLVVKATAMIQKLLSHPTIVKKLGPDVLKRLCIHLGKTVAGKILVKGASVALKFIPIAGWILTAAQIAWDFTTGMLEAKRYFKIDKGEKATFGMRLTSGLVKVLVNNLLFGLVPVDWLANIVYNFIAPEKDKEILRGKQSRFAERAKELGIDPKRLSEYENRTVMTKITDIFRSQKSKDARDAKLLGFESVEAYQEWKKKYKGETGVDPKNADKQPTPKKEEDPNSCTAKMKKFALTALLPAKLAFKGAKFLAKQYIKSAKQSAKILGKVLRFTLIPGLDLKLAGKAIKKGASWLFERLQAMISTIFLSIKVIKNYLDPAFIKQLINNISGLISAKFAGVSSCFDKVLRFLNTGLTSLFMPPPILFSVGYDFLYKAYFKLDKGQKHTTGMRIASGITNVLIVTLLNGLIGPGELAGQIYKFIEVKDKQAEDITTKHIQNDELKRRAKMLGLDPKKLSDVEKGDILKKSMTDIKDQAAKNKVNDALKKEAQKMGYDDPIEWLSVKDKMLLKDTTGIVKDAMDMDNPNSCGAKLKKMASKVISNAIAPFKVTAKLGIKAGKSFVEGNKVLGKSLSGMMKKFGTMIAEGHKVVAIKTLERIKAMLNKLLNISVISKYINKTNISKFIETLSQKIASKLESISPDISRTGSNIIRFLMGPAGVILWPIDFMSGMATAGKYYKIDKGQKITGKMRIAAGITKLLLKNVLLGLVPVDWLAGVVYNTLTYYEKDTEAAGDQRSAAVDERSKAIGVEPKKLENTLKAIDDEKSGRDSAKGQPVTSKDATKLGFESNTEMKKFDSVVDKISNSNNSQSAIDKAKANMQRNATTKNLTPAGVSTGIAKPEEANLGSSPVTEKYKDMNKKMDNALAIDRLIDHNNQLFSVLRSDLGQIISLLSNMNDNSNAFRKDFKVIKAYFVKNIKSGSEAEQTKQSLWDNIVNKFKGDKSGSKGKSGSYGDIESNSNGNLGS